jgi:hypothetical protein
MVEEYQRNHFVPQFMLDRWARQGDDNPRRLGTHMFLIRERRYEFSNALGNRAHPRAYGDDLYVPRDEDGRATSLERWFSGHEGALASFVAALDQRQVFVPRDAMQATLAVQGLFGLNFRSRHQIEALSAYLADHDDPNALVGGDLDRSVQQIVLENIINQINHMNLKALPLSGEVFHAERPSFIIGDQPSFQVDEDTWCTVLTPTTVLQYGRGDGTVGHNDLDDDLVTRLNEIVAMHAREWIVAPDRATLDALAPIFDSERYQETLASEEILTEPTILYSGWRIKD